ncbi:hypothetical protein [Streptomyces sp. AC1-42T]|uniref:hypothetical protein n=1 Tax=Streptomyces sp. AC1-42T TaxID=2218665 RepID=UPI000DAE69CC|nr:hypothetical protein [Streptomyces sp. AC1-42T]PZT71542.1 hypothetical protein DNK55_33070 [Streptomyces sp. AC1-42T]
MTHTRLHAETGRGSRDILRSVRSEIGAELLRRHPGSKGAQYAAKDLPLRMTIYLDVDTDRVAARILNAERLRTNPGDPEAQHHWLEEPLETWIEYDLDDLDREGPLPITEFMHVPPSAGITARRPTADRRPRRVVIRAVQPGRPRTLLQRVMGR